MRNGKCKGRSSYEKNRCKDLEREAIKERRIHSQVEMYYDMAELYSMLLKRLD